MARLARLGAAFLSLALASVVLPLPASGQALKLPSLQITSSSQVGPWVSYRVRGQTRALPVREYTQRVAIVAREKHPLGYGFWVELKTEGLSSGRRIERGFFVPASGPGERPYELERYQVLHSNGKLYEYPPQRLEAIRASGDISTIELFEYDPDVPPVTEALGPDTLRLGQRVVPAEAERSLRASANAWPVRGDTAWVNRPLLVQTVWKNPAVPITGIARSLFQVVTERVPSNAKDAAPAGSSAPPVPSLDPVLTAASAAPAGETTVPARPDGSAASGDSTAVAVPGSDSTAAAAPAVPDPAAAKPTSTMLSWTDLILVDLGSDAKPEVTQTPEPLPEDAATAPPDR